jgi:outer membrane protein assembly factor BamD (BamD/ComL family)
MQKAPLRTTSRRQEPKPTKEKTSLEATLGQEIQLFKKAKGYFDSHDYTQADKALNLLAQTFPNHPLGVELRLLQIRTQLALSNNDTALKMMQNLLSNPPTKPRAQWYKLLGEIQQVRKRCGPALIAYSKALKMGLGSRQEQEVRQAVGRCSRDQ